jgi:Flp pilus assembly protein TadG
LGSRRGSQAVEFALTLPIIFVILSGILDYGWYFSQSIAVVQATRDGTRGAVRDEVGCAASEATAEADVAARITAAGVPGTPSVDATVIATGGATGTEDALVVVSTVAFAPLWGLVPTPANMGATVTFRNEDQSC